MATYAVLFEDPWERIPMAAQNTPQWSATVRVTLLKRKMPSEKDYTLDHAPWLHIRIIQKINTWAPSPQLVIQLVRARAQGSICLRVLRKF